MTQCFQMDLVGFEPLHGHQSDPLHLTFIRLATASLMTPVCLHTVLKINIFFFYLTTLVGWRASALWYVKSNQSSWIFHRIVEHHACVPLRGTVGAWAAHCCALNCASGRSRKWLGKYFLSTFHAVVPICHGYIQCQAVYILWRLAWKVTKLFSSFSSLTALTCLGTARSSLWIYCNKMAKMTGRSV